jgi:hypothetical protein
MMASSVATSAALATGIAWTAAAGGCDVDVLPGVCALAMLAGTEASTMVAANKRRRFVTEIMLFITNVSFVFSEHFNLTKEDKKDFEFSTEQNLREAQSCSASRTSRPVWSAVVFV